MSRYLFAVHADSSRFVGRLATIKDGMSPDDIGTLIERYYRMIGEGFVIYDSTVRPDMLPNTGSSVCSPSTSPVKEERSIFRWGDASDSAPSTSPKNGRARDRRLTGISK